MKFSFKKITALASTALMAMGVVAAASYPAPFVSGSSADVAIVYGTGVGVDSSDFVQATSIQTDLDASYTGGEGVATATGGDVYTFEKETSKLHVGDNINDVVSLSLDDDDLPNLLASGVYVDDDNDEFDYDQSIDMADLQVIFFEDNDYKDDVPTLGVKINRNDAVLNYSLEFSDTPSWDDLETTDLTMLGKSYYVLDADNSSQKLTLLDSASTAIVTEGETKTVEGKSVSISYISSSEVALTIDGEETNSLAEGETQKLKDGSYVGIKDIRYQEKQGTVSSVEISLGSGKLILENGQKVELNDDQVEELEVAITSSSNELETITIQWVADDEAFITEDSEVVMPGFEAVKLSFGGVDFPAKEEFSIKPSGDNVIVLDNFPTKKGTIDIPLVEFNDDGTIGYIGESDGDELLTTDQNSLVFNESKHAWFVASYKSGDEAESYLLRASNIREDTSAGKNYTDIQYYDGSNWVTKKSDLDSNDDVTIGNVELDINEINDDEGTVNISTSSSNVNFYKLYSAEGLEVVLPVSGTSSGYLNLSVDSSWTFQLNEEDEDDNIAQGEQINVTVSTTNTGSSNKSTVSSIGVSEGSGWKDTSDSDVTEQFVYSALASKLTYDQSGDQDEVTIEYHGGDSAAKLMITAPSVTLAKGDGLGNIVVKDSEVSSVSDKNLIVVGGSCINSVAATILGGSYCGAEFTSATGVGTGQFLIQSVESPYDSSKTALLVAGYEAADTVAAAKYLTTQTVDTSVGKKYIGTGATSAELVVE